jgi:hypothetical protein
MNVTCNEGAVSYVQICIAAVLGNKENNHPESARIWKESPIYMNLLYCWEFKEALLLFMLVVYTHNKDFLIVLLCHGLFNDIVSAADIT